MVISFCNFALNFLVEKYDLNMKNSTRGIIDCYTCLTCTDLNMVHCCIGNNLFNGLFETIMLHCFQLLNKYLEDL